MVANPQARVFTAFGAAYEILQRRYGGILVAKTFNVPVLQGVPIVPSDPERVFIAFKADVGIGIVGVWIAPIINPAEGFICTDTAVIFNERDHSLMPTLEWFGVSSFAGQSVFGITIRRDVQAGPIAEDIG